MAAYRVVLFQSTTHALRAETVVQRVGLRVKMIPTPRQLSSDCGLAMRFEPADEEQVVSVLAENNVPTNGIHAL